jgi:uncharacterized membrane protein YhhN
MYFHAEKHRASSNTMEDFLHKRTLAIYWIVLLLSASFLYFDPKYTILTEPLLVPLLLVYLFLKDNNIGKPLGKLIFFIGMFLAFLGDVLQVVIHNELFFISSLVAFMLMNICYSISFFSLHKTGYRRPWPFLISCIVLFFVAYFFIDFIGDDKLGDYKMPITLYIITVCLMVSLATNLTGSKLYRMITLSWLLPGAIVFLIQNMLLAINLFHFGGQHKLYIFSIIPYGIAQYLIVKGMRKVYAS